MATRCVALALLILTSSPVASTQRECAYCKMILYAKEFGGEIETTSGEVLVFDAVECIAASYYRSWNVPRSEVKAIRFVDYRKPEVSIPSSKATLLKTKSVRSPMGLNVVALSSRAAAKKMKKSPEDEILTWNECVELVRTHWKLPAP